jgi:DNA-binding transcriptional LysR family regulator
MWQTFAGGRRGEVFAAREAAWEAAGLPNRSAKLHSLVMFDWNDLRHFLAVARHGSTIRAAKALGVNQSTVHRRIAELERRLGRLLFERRVDGYRLTTLGQELRPIAERAETTITDFERYAASGDTQLVGTIRVTCPETAGYRMMKSPLLDVFHGRFPGLRVELLMVDRVLDLAKGEADIAFRTVAPQDDALVVRKIAEVPWAVFASRSYIQRRGLPQKPNELNAHDVIRFDGAIADHTAARWMKTTAPHARITAHCTSVPAVVLAVTSGAGISPLPVIAVERETDLVRLFGSIPELRLPFYLLIHRDMQRTPRVRAFCDFVSSEIKAFRELLVGETDRIT